MFREPATSGMVLVCAVTGGKDYGAIGGRVLDDCPRAYVWIPIIEKEDATRGLLYDSLIIIISMSHVARDEGMHKGRGWRRVTQRVGLR